MSVKQWSSIWCPYILAAIFLGTVFYREIGEPFYYDGFPRGWFFQFQTILAALIGSSAAVIIWYQYKDTLRRKEFLIKAKMNDGLSDICGYTRKCFFSIQNESTLPEKSEGIEVLKSAIEVVLNQDTAESIYELVIFYQVHNARLERDHEKTARDKVGKLYDSVKLYALTLRFFGFARNSDRFNRPVAFVKNTKPSKQEMYSAFREITDIWPHLIDNSDHSELYAELFKDIDLFHK